MQLILKSIRDLPNIQNIARVKFKQQPFNVLQEKLTLANVRNTSIYQALMCVGFGLQKKQGFPSSRVSTPDHGTSIFVVYRLKPVNGASRKTAPTIFFFLAKIAD